ncbi:PDE2A isoform 18, partial [Pongo abelii]
MVLVLHHILIAVVQFLRRGQQVFLKPDEPPPPQPCADSLQDALLSLGSVIDISGLQRAVKEALSAVLPRVETVYTYLLDGESRLVCEDPPHELPQEGKVRCTVASC